MTKLIDAKFISSEMATDQELLSLKDYILTLISNSSNNEVLEIINGGKANSVYLAELINGGKANG